MTKSLEHGPSKMVPVRFPKSLIDRIKLCLGQGETYSELTRAYWERECDARERAAKAKSDDLKRRHKALKRKAKHG